MGNEYCAVCNEELKFMNTPNLGGGKLKDGERVCRFCFKKLADIDVGFGLTSRTNYDKAKVLELLSVSPTGATAVIPKISQSDRVDMAHENSPIRCPLCKSTQISANKKGFGMGTAAVGGLCFGPIGLLGGLLDSGKVKITCLGCGHVFNPGQGRYL